GGIRGDRWRGGAGVRKGDDDLREALRTDVGDGTNLGEFRETAELITTGQNALGEADPDIQFVGNLHRRRDLLRGFRGIQAFEHLHRLLGGDIFGTEINLSHTYPPLGNATRLRIARTNRISPGGSVPGPVHPPWH